MNDKPYRKVAVGGTFDKFHEGHRKLVDKAFEIGSYVVIGVTSNEFGGAKGKIEPCKIRMSNLRSLLQEKPPDYDIQELNEPYGTTIFDEEIDAIVVSEETEPTALEINRIRRENGMKALDILSIGMVLAEDGRPISSTRIRKGEIDREGSIIMDDQ
ncbi:phosphopantetheine adenylyltransferase [Methanobacterium aggregans]|uniref:phosphopantetheine adenylyltransferase n=1 Tax=Methanobacterium aggregans TaxID=1615586 RepID=UPI001AEAB414|nr:phosphopantetheine adenylyltransferase [Methanobacterium aggregans]MBP2044838.1 pantetheine-phosphate adenylyltransferase [Methanobacterium aggregans]